MEFLSGVLTFGVPREEDREGHGSGSEGSPKSSEGSPENAASTLLAPPHNKDHDQEDASRTLVLASPANGLVSPGDGLVSPGDGQATFTALTPQSERPPPYESEPGTLSSIIRSDPRPIIAVPTVSMVSASGGTSSPPFTKVERTFIHIAETSHMNVMTARHQPPGLEEEPAAEPHESDEERREKMKGESDGEEEESRSEEVLRKEEEEEDGEDGEEGESRSKEVLRKEEEEEDGEDGEEEESRSEEVLQKEEEEEEDGEDGKEEKEEDIKSETEEHRGLEVEEKDEERPDSEEEIDRVDEHKDIECDAVVLEGQAENLEEEISEKAPDGESESESEKSAEREKECKESISTRQGAELEHMPQAAVQSDPSILNAKEPMVLNVLEASAETDLETKPEEGAPCGQQDPDADQEEVCAVPATGTEREEELKEGACLDGETPPLIGAETKGEEIEASVPSSRQRRSRIPVPVSEEDSGSDRSSHRGHGSPHHLKTRRPHLARLVLERRQSLHRQPGPPSSPSLSATASEDDTHQSDESTRGARDRGRPRAAEGQRKSRIPRLVTPVRRPSSPPVATPAVSPHPQTTKATSSLRRLVHHTPSFEVCRSLNGTQ